MRNAGRKLNIKGNERYRSSQNNLNWLGKFKKKVEKAND